MLDSLNSGCIFHWGATTALVNVAPGAEAPQFKMKWLAIMILWQPLGFAIYSTCLNCNILYLFTFKTNFIYRNSKCKTQAAICSSQTRYCLADFISIGGICEAFWFTCPVPGFLSRVLGKKKKIGTCKMLVVVTNQHHKWQSGACTHTLQTGAQGTAPGAVQLHPQILPSSINTPSGSQGSLTRADSSSGGGRRITYPRSCCRLVARLLICTVLPTITRQDQMLSASLHFFSVPVQGNISV